MGWESFDVVGFDLGPLLQGQTTVGKLKSCCMKTFLFRVFFLNLLFIYCRVSYFHSESGELLLIA